MILASAIHAHSTRGTASSLVTTKRAKGCEVEPPWEDATEQQRCQVVVHGDLAACSPQLYMPCDAYVEYVSCEVVEPMECVAIEAELAS